ncbi:23S rRNA m2A2503 methyltransferase and tRNA A37 C2 methyltransferase [Petrocella atlantisensis]|uniref:Probable dual-specificity RNA methyltransferase RlmN n=1 Tax=Petrocella atlantisensis TaxID=2173034 RepID=A0A3P7PMS0_9FIRM|nr:23S rRNA (adenine(2503)-C(2))-methyltransferase RlmN [Petrocella atlantisensis]PKM55225.1 MAG: 23S rRNA (adenine(2503)-C(2))-methyltransferase RlmN [Firmicutes bacterium HGW-Firmicutes-5]VDN45867.1 23S rRNA m2A2503 methyltransferase and tRNA A37 C2 methyltransferase [Petrocella atlantisensis]
MSNIKRDIMSLELDALTQEMILLNEKKFRGIQVFEWLHQKDCFTWKGMNNLPKALLVKLEEHAYITEMQMVTKQTSGHDGTTKFLFKLYDGQMIETVLMRYDYGNSVCISTQAGCRMGCTFCASGLNGLERNLTTGEMLRQVYAVEREIGKRITHVVLMGTGEPLDNYDAVLGFIKIITHDKGKNLSQRHITLSTCGMVDGIRRLASEKLQINLAISLHASDDELRKQTMPIAKKYSIDEILTACEAYFISTGRRITFEYALIAGHNDHPSQARALADLLRFRKFKCHVNLIPINNVVEKAFAKSNQKEVARFRDILLDKKVETTIRRSLGTDIDAACGQLRFNAMKK